RLQMRAGEAGDQRVTDVPDPDADDRLDVASVSSLDLEDRRRRRFRVEREERLDRPVLALRTNAACRDHQAEATLLDRLANGRGDRREVGVVEFYALDAQLGLLEQIPFRRAHACVPRAWPRPWPAPARR